MGYHVAPSGHPDATALALLGHILVDAPSGRLHKALVESKLATKLDFDAVSNLEPGYRLFGAVVPKDGKLDEAQDVMIKVLENLKAEPITDAELARAKQTMQKNIEQAQNDTARLTIALTESMAAGDWRLYYLQRDQLAKVSAAEVTAVATKYLKASNRTLGRFIPTDAPDRAEVPGKPDIAAMVKDYKGHEVVAQGENFDPSPANIEGRTQRFVLPGGMKAAMLPKKTKGGTVAVSVNLRMGTADALAGKGLTGSFAAGLLMRGTERLSRQEVKDAFDKLKAQVTIGGGAEGINATVKTTRENLAPALELLAEVMKKPAYSATEFGEYQRERVGRTEQEMPEPQPLAVNAFQRLLDATPAGHVRHVLTLPEQLAALKAMKVEDVKAFHNAFYGSSHGSVAAVGDFDPVALKAQLSTLFGNWKAGQAFVRIPNTMKPAAGEKVTLETPDKANSMLFAVEPVPMKDDAASFPALMMANHMLGGGALRSRLADRIRQKEGLSYGVGSALNVPSQDPAGVWLAYAISAPQNTAKVEAALREEINRALTEGFTEAELAEAKKGWKQSEEVERTDDAQLARQLSSYLNIDRTMAYNKDLEAKVAALTVAQVNDALRQHLKVANLSVVSAGDFAKANAAVPAAKEAAGNK